MKAVTQIPSKFKEKQRGAQGSPFSLCARNIRNYHHQILNLKQKQAKLTTSFQKALLIRPRWKTFSHWTHVSTKLESLFIWCWQGQAEHPNPQPAFTWAPCSTRPCPAPAGQAGTLLLGLISSFEDLHLCMTLQKDNRANRSLIYIFFSLLP